MVTLTFTDDLDIDVHLHIKFGDPMSKPSLTRNILLPIIHRDFPLILKCCKLYTT